jgi:Na+-driven multidrug efflux pump
MRQGFKAFLLSAFVFPGLGQLYNQDRKKGVLLVLGANLLLGVLLLAGMVLLSQEYLAVFYPRPLTWKLVRLLLLDTISHPFFLIPFGLLMALWGFAMVDAARGAGRPKPAAVSPSDPFSS